MAKSGFDKAMSIGIDIGKDAFHLVGFDQDGRRVLRKQIKRVALIMTINQILAFLIEQGITVRKGLRALKNSFETILEERKDEMSPQMRRILIGVYSNWMWMDDRVDKVSKEISRTE